MCNKKRVRFVLSLCFSFWGGSLLCSLCQLQSAWITLSFKHPCKQKAITWRAANPRESLKDALILYLMPTNVLPVSVTGIHSQVMLRTLISTKSFQMRCVVLPSTYRTPARLLKQNGKTSSDHCKLSESLLLLQSRSSFSFQGQFTCLPENK